MTVSFLKLRLTIVGDYTCLGFTRQQFSSLLNDIMQSHVKWLNYLEGH